MTTNAEYIKKYSSNSSYKTDSKLYPKPFFPSLKFYINLLRILGYSNKQAKQNLYNDERWSNSSVDVVESLEKSGLRMIFEGIENILQVESPAVYISNHMSTLETMVLPSIIQPNRKVVYVIKEELAKYPLFGPIAMARYPILVGRENPREDLKAVLEQGSERIQNGKSIIIFPQKTRTKFFDAASFNSLGVKLAKKNNVPVIPVALYTEAWGNGKYIKEVGKIDPKKEVRISFGSPVYVKGNGSAEHQIVIDFIKQKFTEWGLKDLIIS